MAKLTYEEFKKRYQEVTKSVGIDVTEDDAAKAFMAVCVVREWDNEQHKKERQKAKVRIHREGTPPLEERTRQARRERIEQRHREHSEMLQGIIDRQQKSRR